MLLEIRSGFGLISFELDHMYIVFKPEFCGFPKFVHATRALASAGTGARDSGDCSRTLSDYACG